MSPKKNNFGNSPRGNDNKKPGGGDGGNPQVKPGGFGGYREVGENWVPRPPVLVYTTTGQNNFYEFKQGLIIFAEAKYGRLGTCIRNGVHWDPPAVTRPSNEDLSPESDPFGLTKSAYLKSLDRRDDMLAEMSKQYVKFSADIESMLSTGSKAALKTRAEKYREFEVNRDPLIYFQLIVETHQGSMVGSEAIDQATAVKVYYGLRH